MPGAQTMKINTALSILIGMQFEEGLHGFFFRNEGKYIQETKRFQVSVSSVHINLDKQLLAVLIIENIDEGS